MASILTISAHPDDESLFGGGTLAMYAEQGHSVYILETTRGEGGEVGRPPLTTQEDLGTYREQEVRKAARFLGAWYKPAEHERILNNNDAADIVHDVTPWPDAKIAAALSHQTQHAMFLRNSGAPSVREMVWNTESFHIWQGSLPRDLSFS